MPRRIAIVEDDAAIRANYADALRKHGYEVSAHAARGEAMGAFRTRLPDLAVIDIGLGEEPDGGFTLCRELRALAPGLPILFLTARDSDFDAVSGLRLGADDYLTKDVSLPHLLARISAVSQDRCAARAEGGRGSARTRAAQARREALHRVVERQAGRADAHRVLDGAHARKIPRPRERSRRSHARGEPGRGRGHDHFAREAHPQEIHRGRSRVRADRHGVRHGLPLEGVKDFNFSLRTKLALVALVLLALPWAGYNYVREMERFLLEGQEQALLATARAVATALHDRPKLMRAPPPRDTDVRREAEEELRRLAAERGEPPDEGSGPTLIIDRE